MKTTAFAAALALILVADAASAQQARPAQGRQCFNIRAVRGYNAIDRETVNIRTDGNEVYQLKLFGPCGTIDFSFGTALKTRGVSSFVCNAQDLDVVAPSPIGPQSCQVRTLRKLSRAEVAALPRRQQP